MPDQPIIAPQVFPSRLRWLPYAALALLTLLLYAPSFNYGFVWDDYEYIVENTRIQGLSLAHWKVIWTLPAGAQYAPLHHTLLALLYQLGGLNPFVYHVAQVLLHALCACLLYALLRRMESETVAAVAAALFVVHPANIENVAWVTETKSTMALLFFLISFLLYLRLGEGARPVDLATCAIFFLLSLLSKASTVAGPVVMLLYTLRHSRPRRAQLNCAALLFGISVALTLLTLHFWQGLNADTIPDRLTDGVLLADGAAPLSRVGKYYGGWWVHLLNLPGLLWFYVQTTVWPAQLSLWQMFPVATGWSVRVGLEWLSLLAACALLLRGWLNERWRGVAFWASWFLLFLAPILQLVPNPAWVADRYLYIPAIGAFVLCGMLIQQEAQRGTALAGYALAGLMVLGLAWSASRQLPAWKSDVAAWSAGMNTCSKSAFCHMMLSLALRREAREAASANPAEQARLRADAVQEAVVAVNLRPVQAKWVYLGDALADAGDARALNAYMKAREMMNPPPMIFWAQVGKAHYKLGHVADAARIVAQLQPAGAEDPTVLMLQAFVDWRQGRSGEARQAIGRIMAMNTLYPQVPERTLRFVTQYWGNAAEAAQMLREVQAP